MGKRDVVFLTLCVTGGLVLLASLWRPERVAQPRHYVSLAHVDADFQNTVRTVEEAFQREWTEAGLEAAPTADHLTLARRLSLALTGAVPSLEELRAYERVAPDERLSWWLSHLFDDRRYADYTAERLARTYVGTDFGAFLVFRRRRFVSWLSDRLYQDDLRYDGLVRRLLSDDGLWTDQPAVNFVTATSDPNKDNQPDPIKLANRTTRAFLGMRIDCLQCHDDHLDKIFLGDPASPRGGQQRDFHQLAAFFGNLRNSGVGIRDKKGKDASDYKYQLRASDEEEVVAPAVPFLPDLDPGANAGTQRKRLAAWVTSRENRPFARATVNRVWALVCGRPLVEPVDDLPLHGPFPPALEALADDFRTHDFDLRRLIRLIVATSVFQRDSRAEFTITPEHEQHWAVFPITRLRPEQVAGAVFQASTLSTVDAESNLIRKLMKVGQVGEFVNRYGDTGEDEFTARAGTIPQRLLLMNGQLVYERTEENFVLNAATRISVLARSAEDAVETTYLVTLTRRPTDDERTHFAARLKPLRGNQRNQAVEDLFWVLINSSEFSWNH